MLLAKAYLYLAAQPELGQSQQTAKEKLIAWLESLKEIHGQARQFIDSLKLWDTVDDMETGTVDLMADQTE
jgi:thioredoxin-like negative regulator of GroEL